MAPEPGDRVVVRLSGQPDEMDAHRGEHFPCAVTPAVETVVFGHLDPQEGRTGQVAICAGGFPCRFLEPLNHGYVIVYDQPYLHADRVIYGGHYAAEELEPVATPAALQKNNPAA